MAVHYDYYGRYHDDDDLETGMVFYERDSFSGVIISQFTITEYEYTGTWTSYCVFNATINVGVMLSGNWYSGPLDFFNTGNINNRVGIHTNVRIVYQGMTLRMWLV